MATNYSYTSFNIPRGWPEEAKREFVHLCMRNGAVYKGVGTYEPKTEAETELASTPDERDKEADPLFFGDPGWSDLGSGFVDDTVDGDCGFWNEDTFEEEVMTSLLNYLVKKYRIPRRHAVKIGISYTCSRPCAEQFGGSQVEIYDTSTQPHEPMRGCLETPPTWSEALCRTFMEGLSNLKGGNPLLLMHPSPKLEKYVNHVYPELNWHFFETEGILRVEDMEWFSPDMMDALTEAVFTSYAAKTGHWPTTPAMTYWSPVTGLLPDDYSSGHHLAYIPHRHASAQEVKLAQKLHKERKEASDE